MSLNNSSLLLYTISSYAIPSHSSMHTLPHTYHTLSLTLPLTLSPSHSPPSHSPPHNPPSHSSTHTSHTRPSYSSHAHSPLTLSPSYSFPSHSPPLMHTLTCDIIILQCGPENVRVGPSLCQSGKVLIYRRYNTVTITRSYGGTGHS